jgi:UDP-N-acetyl-D-glucosamine dehydrogenase
MSTHAQVARFTPADSLEQKIQARSAKVGIIGLGYVGLPLALLYSEQKFPVTGFDIDRRKVDTLNSGGSYIYRILPTEIALAREQGFAATADFARLHEMDAVIICVPTPLDEHHEPDLSYIEATARAIAPHVREGQLTCWRARLTPAQPRKF